MQDHPPQDWLARGNEVCTVTIRVLHASDVEALRELRLRALREEPTAFLRTPEEEEPHPVAWFAERLREQDGTEADVVLGAFTGPALVGMVGLRREQAARARHRVNLWGMYIAPEARGRGMGRALLDAALAHARQAPGVAQVHLGVTTENTAAIALYRAAGFRITGQVPSAMQVAGRFLDEQLMVLVLR